MPNKYCHECGNELIENAKFCSSCAAAVVSLSSNTPAPAPTPAVTPTPTPTPTVTPTPTPTSAPTPAPEPTLTVPAEKTEMEPIEKEPDYSWDLMAPTPKNEVELANKSKDEKPSEITDAEMEKEQLEIEQWHDAFKVGGFIFTALIGVVVFAALIGTCSSVPQ